MDENGYCKCELPDGKYPEEDFLILHVSELDLWVGVDKIGGCMSVTHVNKTVTKLVEVKEEVLEKVVIECTPLQAALLKIILSKTTSSYFSGINHNLFPENEVNLPIFQDIISEGKIKLHLLKQSDVDFIMKCLVDKK